MDRFNERDFVEASTAAGLETAAELAGAMALRRSAAPGLDGGIGENGVQLRHDSSALSDRAADALDRARADVAHREYAGDARFERKRSA
jgi:hypothetical protein